MAFVWILAPFFWWQRQLVDIAANVGELIWLSLVAYCVCLSHHLRGVTFQKLFIKDVDCFVVNNVWRCEFHEEYRIRLQRWSWILPLLQTILLRKYQFGKKRTSLDLSDFGWVILLRVYSRNCQLLFVFLWSRLVPLRSAGSSPRVSFKTCRL